MLSEFELAVLKNNSINPDEVEAVSKEYVVTLKDGTKHQIVECYSRVMGYIKPMSEYNVGKRQEHDDRQLFRRYEDEASIKD